AFASEFAAENHAGALQVFQRTFASRKVKPVGLYVLLAACGANLDADHVNVLAEHPNEPLAENLEIHSSPLLRRHAQLSERASLRGLASLPPGLPRRLAEFNALFQRWKNGRASAGSVAKRKDERERTLDFVRRNQTSFLGWILLCQMQERLGEEDQAGRALAR